MSIQSLGGALSESPQVLQQCASAVLMIRPAAFDYNPETAVTNKMQSPDARLASTDAGIRLSGRSEASAHAVTEFDALAQALRTAGVNVCVVEDTLEPPKPDAVFPNNWISFHEGGTVVLYPMQPVSRRLERRRDVIEVVVAATGFKVARVLDLTAHEAQGRFLEGTGSLVLDRPRRVAYACLSPRTDPVVLEEWCREFGYHPCLFEAVDRKGVPLYHTNVMMCVGMRAVVVASESIVAKDRGRVLESLRAGGREVIEIGHREVEQFAGNMLELGTPDAGSVLVMSEAARRSLGDGELFSRLSACTDRILVAPVPTIERLGGGSVRCMLAEVFAPAAGVHWV